MKETIQDLTTRRSVKRYQPTQINRADLEKILKAGMNAPSGMGRQSAVMVVVQEPETVKKLSRMNAEVMGGHADPFYGAPTVIIVFADKEVPTYKEDGSLVMGNLLNAAHALGLGSCWINAGKEFFPTDKGKQYLKELKVPDGYVPVGTLILGYAAETPQPAPRREGTVIRIG